MKKHRLVRLGVVCAAGLIAAGLSGCTPVSHVSIGLQNGALKLALCEPTKVNQIRVQAASPSAEPLSYDTKWTVDGPTQQLNNLVLPFGVAPKGFRTSVPASDFDFRSSKIDVEFDFVSKKVLESGAVQVFNGDKLVEGKWLNWDQQIVATPCAG